MTFRRRLTHQYPRRPLRSPPFWSPLPRKPRPRLSSSPPSRRPARAGPGPEATSLRYLTNVPRCARHLSPGTSTPPARHRRDFTPSPRFYAIEAIQQNILLPRPPVLKLEVFALRVESGRTGCGRGLAAAAQRSQTCRGGVSRDALSRARIWHPRISAAAATPAF